LTLTSIRPQHEIYTDNELLPGANRNGLTITEERLRLSLLQGSMRNWPKQLINYLKQKHAHDRFCLDVIQVSVIDWIKSERKMPVVFVGTKKNGRFCPTPAIDLLPKIHLTNDFIDDELDEVA
jgi:hypothetical protein